MKQIIQTISLILLLGACTDEKYTDTLTSQGGEHGELVPVELSLNIQPEQSALSSGTKAGGRAVRSTQVCNGLEISMTETPVTRATYEDEVKNYWVLQFNGTTAGSKLALKQFIEGNSVKSVALNKLGAGVKSKIIVVANAAQTTFASLNVDVTSLNDFNEMGILNTATGFPLFHDAASSTDRVLFVGSTDMVVEVGKQADVMLYRSVARVKINLSFSAAMQQKGYTNWSYQFMNIPEKTFYHSTGRTAVFPDETIPHYNYPQNVISASSTASIENYLPVNLQLSVPFTTAEKRAVNAPAKATYLQLVGMKMTASGIISRSVVYQIHLGSNFEDDYSISPNFSYNYDITVTGENEDDSRVIKFIPGYFSGELKTYSADGSPTTNASKIVSWRYEKRFEVYISDVNETGGITWLGTGTMPVTDNSLMDGRKNTWDLRQNTQYLAIQRCIALNGTAPQSIEAMTWYTPSFGQSLSIYVAGSNTLKTLPDEYYWSSTANSSYAWATQVRTGQCTTISPTVPHNLRCVKDVDPNNVVL